MVDISINSDGDRTVIGLNEENLNTFTAPSLKYEMSLLFQDHDEGDIVFDLSNVRKIGDRTGDSAILTYGRFCMNAGQNAFLKGANDSIKNYIKEMGSSYCFVFI